MLMKNDPEKRDTINRFMDDEIDYFGDVEVHHFLSLVKDKVGWQALSKKVKTPLTGVKIASYYGCTGTEVSRFEFWQICVGLQYFISQPCWRYLVTLCKEQIIARLSIGRD